MEPKFRRSRLWIDPPFQGKLLLRMGLYLGVYTLIVWHLGFALEAIREIVARGAPRSLADLYADYFWNQLPLLVTFVLLVPALLYNLLKFSHRIAGPLFRCRKMMREMTAGKAVNEFKPRKGDLMGELFDAFNGLIRAHNGRVAVVPSHAAEVPAKAAPSGRHKLTS